MNDRDLKRVVEVVLLTAERPLLMDELADLALMDASVGGLELEGQTRQAVRDQLRTVLGVLGEECAGRGIELSEVASGYRYQVKASFAHWVSRLHADRPARYSRALLETLALIAYRQPVTRGEIEDIRGVGVSSSIMKTLHEREWIRILGHREVPGRPAMYGTTRKFLDDFNLKRLDELPPLAEVRDLENIHADLFSAAGPAGGEVSIATGPARDAPESEGSVDAGESNSDGPGEHKSLDREATITAVIEDNSDAAPANPVESDPSEVGSGAAGPIDSGAPVTGSVEQPGDIGSPEIGSVESPGSSESDGEANNEKASGSITLAGSAPSLDPVLDSARSLDAGPSAAAGSVVKIAGQSSPELPSDSREESSSSPRLEPGPEADAKSKSKSKSGSSSS